MIMLDTNICIHILKERPEHIRQKFNKIDSVHISSIVYSKLSYGIENSPERLQAARRKQLNAFLALVTIHSWDERAAEHYGRIRAHLKKNGTMIGNMDLLIAAHALSLDAALITNNTHEFERIPNLNLEIWYARGE
ncbi:MAG: type II toxin-antitoxin system VapC family toxin [Chloroflexi bacterium]|nr:type II toxin-antitoxin system VapC family toxin [Chloroflexota bacterium]